MKEKAQSIINNHLAGSAETLLALARDAEIQNSICRAASEIDSGFKNGKRLYIAGNGGSAADAQHFAAELVGYFGGSGDKPLPAIALTTDSSFLTAWSNDTDFESVFARQLKAHARAGDIFFAISTSGNSKNIFWALGTAQKIGMRTIALLGRDGGSARARAHISIVAPSHSTAHIQEAHIAVIHAICACIDR
jgi:D-sedoheptulose 7-phosphate isomerase